MNLNIFISDASIFNYNAVIEPKGILCDLEFLKLTFVVEIILNRKTKFKIHWDSAWDMYISSC